METQDSDECQIYLSNLIISGTYIVIGVVGTVFASIALYRKRFTYPILERSPVITIFAMWVLFLSTLGMQIEDFLQYHWKDRYDSPLYKVVGDMLFYYFLIFQLLKISRLIYVIHAKNSRATIVKLLRNEILLCVLTLMVLIAISSFIIGTMIVTEQINDMNFVKDFKFYEVFPCAIDALIVGVATFFLRKLETSYQIFPESLFLAGYLLLLDLVIGFTLIVTPEIGCDYFFVHQVVDILFQVAYVCNAVCYPLYISQPYHQQLAPSMILNDFRLFVQDSKCLINFGGYLEYLDLDPKTRLRLAQQKETLKFLHSSTLSIIQGNQNTSINLHNFVSRQFLAHFRQSRNLGKNEAWKIDQSPKKVKTMTDSDTPYTFFYCNLLSFYLDVIKVQLQNEGDISESDALRILKEYFLGEGILMNPRNSDHSHSPLTKNSFFSYKNPSSAQSDQALHGLDDSQSSAASLVDQIMEMVANDQFELMINIVQQFTLFTEKYLTEIYHQGYMKTYSFQALKQEKNSNEQITRNLYMLNMTLYYPRAQSLHRLASTRLNTSM